MGRSINQRIQSLNGYVQNIATTLSANPHVSCCGPPPIAATKGRRVSSANTSTACVPPCSPADCGDLSHPFFCAYVPPTSLTEYIRRLIRYIGFQDDDTCFVVAMIYLQRARGNFFAQTGQPLLSQFSMHRLFFACCVMAAKYQQEKPFNNKHYSDVGGVALAEVLAMEIALLQLLECNLFCEENDFLIMEEAIFAPGGCNKSPTPSCPPSRMSSVNDLASMAQNSPGLPRTPSLFRLTDSGFSSASHSTPTTRLPVHHGSSADEMAFPNVGTSPVPHAQRIHSVKCESQVDVDTNVNNNSNNNMTDVESCCSGREGGLEDSPQPDEPIAA